MNWPDFISGALVGVIVTLSVLDCVAFTLHDFKARYQEAGGLWQPYWLMFPGSGFLLLRKYGFKRKIKEAV